MIGVLFISVWWPAESANVLHWFVFSVAVSALFQLR